MTASVQGNKSKTHKRLKMNAFEYGLDKTMRDIFGKCCLRTHGKKQNDTVTHNVEPVADVVPEPLDEGTLLHAFAHRAFQLGRGSFILQGHWGDVGHLKKILL